MIFMRNCNGMNTMNIRRFSYLFDAFGSSLCFNGKYGSSLCFQCHSFMSVSIHNNKMTCGAFALKTQI